MTKNATYATHKDTETGRHETIARRQARAMKYASPFATTAKDAR